MKWRKRFTKYIPVVIMIYFSTCLDFICDDTGRTKIDNSIVYGSLKHKFSDSFHGTARKSATVLELAVY